MDRHFRYHKEHGSRIFNGNELAEAEKQGWKDTPEKAGLNAVNVPEAPKHPEKDILGLNPESKPEASVPVVEAPIAPAVEVLDETPAEVTPQDSIETTELESADPEEASAVVYPCPEGMDVNITHAAGELLDGTGFSLSSLIRALGGKAKDTNRRGELQPAFDKIIDFYGDQIQKNGREYFFVK